MSHDFAKNKKKNRQKEPVKASSPGAKGFIPGLICGALLTSIIYFSIENFRNGPAVEQSAATPPENTVQQTPDEASGAAETEFTFYETLPESQVKINVKPVAIENTPQESGVTYYLLAGSFQTPDEAEAQRAKILLLNMEVRVAQVLIAGRTWHRVLVGPFNERNTREKAVETLAFNNIDTIVLKSIR